MPPNCYTTSTFLKKPLFCVFERGGVRERERERERNHAPYLVGEELKGNHNLKSALISINANELFVQCKYGARAQTSGKGLNAETPLLLCCSLLLPGKENLSIVRGMSQADLARILALNQLSDLGRGDWPL